MAIGTGCVSNPAQMNVMVIAKIIVMDRSSGKAKSSNQLSRHESINYTMTMMTR
jgi:hypothetical protein